MQLADMSKQLVQTLDRDKLSAWSNYHQTGDTEFSAHFKQLRPSEIRENLNTRSVRCVNRLFTTLEIERTYQIRYGQWLASVNTAQILASPNDEVPESEINHVEASTVPQRCGHFIPTTRAALQDFPMLQSVIETGLIVGLEAAIDTHILTSTVATSRGLLSMAGLNLTQTTTIHAALKEATANVRNTNLGSPYNIQADTAICSPDAWQALSDETDASGNYIVKPDAVEPRLWGLRLVESAALPPKTVLVLDANVITVARTPLDAGLRSSVEHKDYFTRGMALLLADSFVSVLCYAPTAVCRISTL